MIKQFIFIFSILVLVTQSRAQQQYIDSLRHEIVTAENDTVKTILLSTITEAYIETKPDSAVYFAEQLLALTRKLNFKLNEAGALAQLGYAYVNIGNYPRSLQTLLLALVIAEDPKSEQNIIPDKYIDLDEYVKRPVTDRMLRLSQLSKVHQNLGILYGNTNNYTKELFHYLQARQTVEQTGYIPILCTINSTLGRVYLSLKMQDSALICAQRAYDLSMQIGYKKYLGSILLNLGRIHSAMGNKQLATEYYRKALAASIEHDYLRGVVAGNLLLSDLYRQSGKRDSSLHYANAALGVAGDLNSPDLLLRSYIALAAYYRSNNIQDSTVKYQELIIKMNDSLFNSKQVQQFQNIDFNEQQRQQEMEAAEKAYQNRLQKYLLLAGLAGFLLVVIFLWRNNQQRQKSNAILQRQKKEIENALADLQITQKQLIQSEKMASLGELTAGIAHEIQNPLNFVNNFSEVNTELITEMRDEIDKGNMDQVKAIANDISENEQKVIFHGKRADAIVKSMLQHSRSSSGKKEPTDINALAEEYLRLAYHGLRAKDKTFNATMKTDFDNSIGNINIIPQDIGRVILNLITNAFYVVTEKKKQFGDGYDPIVTLITKKINDKVEIRVKDNGNGIPQKVMDKIFQPFFSTKPTGQGTGLGLSLSYDIIKAHGGELKVETKESEFAEFIIQLPLK